MVQEDGIEQQSQGEGFHPLPVLSAPAAKARAKHPAWVKARFSYNERYRHLAERLEAHGLHTVCEEAHCPNIGDCWERRTATFMILGDTCTRACSYCAVNTGVPLTLDLEEPARLANTVERMNLKYVGIW